MTSGSSPPCITELDALVAGLSAADRRRFERVFHLSITRGDTVPPEEMHGWIVSQFGSLDAVRRQRIVKVTNRITLEGALFNELRASRPLEAPAGSDDLERLAQSSLGGPFCHPLEGTPADTFGRVRGEACLTASNVAKYDGWHGVVVFDEHHPLRFTAAGVSDYVDTAREWAVRAHGVDPEARYPFFLWNCLWRSGASILHGHAHMLLTRGMHYAKVEGLRRQNLAYRSEHGVSYFSDLITIHHTLGLAVDHGTATILPSLTPFKEREILIIAPEPDSDLTSALYRVLSTFVRTLGVQSFNLALYLPPLAPTPEDWEGFPVIARLVDRGRLSAKTSDIGAMEMFAQSVVTSDPFHLIRALVGESPPR